MKKLRNLVSIIMVMLFTVMNISSLATVKAGAVVAPKPGEIVLNKSAHEYELKAGESTDITLSVSSAAVSQKLKKDVVIAIDISNSMDYGDNPTVMQNTIAAAKNLAAAVLGDGSGSRVAIVRYGTFASAYNFSTNGGWVALGGTLNGEFYSTSTSTVKNVIDNVKNSLSSGNIYNDYYGWYSSKDERGTNTEAGLLMSKLVADKHINTSYTVFMSDGVPTARQVGQYGKPEELYGVTYDGSGNSTSTNEKDEAIAAATALKAVSTVYSISVTRNLDSDELHISDVVMGSAASNNNHYYKTANPETQMGPIYKEIGEKIINTIAKNGVVTDIVPNYFVVSNLPDGMTSKGAIDEPTTLTWNIGDITAGVMTKTYTVTLKPGYYGIIDTNTSAELAYTNHILGTEGPQEFPKPEIKAQPTANNDAYTTADNKSVFKVDAAAAGILANDKNAKIDDAPYFSDKHPEDQNVQDCKIEIVKGLAADGSEGTISDLNLTTGTFKYTPKSSRPADEGKDTYTVSFTYKLVSTDDGKAYQSNEAKVDITVPVPKPVPAIKLTKTVNPENAQVGQDVKYTFKVENIGDTNLTDINITDGMNLEGFNGSIGSLEPGKSGEIVATYKVPKGKNPGDKINNTAEVTGKYEGQTVRSTSTATLNVVETPAPAIRITKSVNPLEAKPGDKVTFTMLVENTGNMELTDITVTDSMVLIDGDFGGTKSAGIPRLAIGDSKTFTGEYTVPSNQTEASITNTATVTGKYNVPDSEKTEEVTSSSTVELKVIIPPAPKPGLSITKTVDPAVTNPGKTVTYMITVTNTGDTDLTNVVVTDPMLSNFNGVIGTLASKQAKTISADYKVPLDASTTDLITNEATVTGDCGQQKLTQTATATLKVEKEVIPVVKNFTIAKTANIGSVNPGGSITYSIVLTNTGNVDLEGLQITDSMLKLEKTIKLEVGKPQTFTGTYSVPSNAVVGSQITNTAKAVYPDKSSEQKLEKDATATVNVVRTVIDEYVPAGPALTPDLSITKTADASSANAGASVNYTITVKNTGNVTLTNVVVKDELVGLNETVASLAQGESKSFTKAYTIPAGTSGSLTNTATASTSYGGTQIARAASNVIAVNAVVTPEPVPGGAVTPVPVPEEPVPGGTAKLPNTGEASPILFYAFGALAILFGIKMKK